MWPGIRHRTESHIPRSAVETGQEIPRRTKHSAFQRQGNDPGFNLRGQLYRIAGVDLTDVPRVGPVTAQVILTEVGPDLRRFRNASAFASRLGHCPENRSPNPSWLQQQAS
jgi:hypothetical protein